MPSDIENTTAVDKNKSEGLPLPEAGLKPSNYREQFSVRLELSFSLFQVSDSLRPLLQGKQAPSHFIEFVLI